MSHTGLRLLQGIPQPSGKRDKLFHGDLCAALLAWAALLQCNTKGEKLSVLSAASKYSRSAMTSFFPEPLTFSFKRENIPGTFNPPSNAHLENRNIYLSLCGSASPWLGTSPAAAFSLAELWSAGSTELGELGLQQGKERRLQSRTISTEVQHQSLHWAEVRWKSSKEVRSGGTRCPGVNSNHLGVVKSFLTSTWSNGL